MIQDARKVLAAIPRPALVVLERAVGNYVDLIPRYTVAKAIDYLQHHRAVAALVTGVFFDGARMFDLLQWVKGNRPTLALVCCRFLPQEPPDMSLAAIRLAVEKLGGTFIDVPSLERQHGEARVDAELRALMLSAVRR